MTLRDALLPVLSTARSIAGTLGLRPYTVAVETVSWSGGGPGKGTRTVVSTPITEASGQPPKARWLSNEEIALGGYSKPTVEIGPVTPDFSGGGNSLATLKGKATAAGSEFYYVLTGPDFPTGARFEVIGDESDRALRYIVRLQRTGDS